MHVATIETLFKIAKKYKNLKLANLIVEYGLMVPEFKIIQFDTIDGLCVSGKGRFINQFTDDVQHDINVARQYADFIESEAGCHSEVNYTIENNILQLSIEIFDGDEKIVLPYLEVLIMDNM